MAEKPEDTFESHDYPEYQEEENLPTRQEWMHNRLYNEPYKNYVSRQKLIESNRVGVRTYFLDSRKTEVKQLKENIIREIIRTFDDESDVDKSKLREIFLKPIDNNNYEVYYKNKPIAKYNVKYNLLTTGDYHELKLEVFKTKYYEQKEEVRTNISTEKELSSLKFEVDIEKSKEYHEKIERLENRIKQLQETNRSLEQEKNERIRSLEQEIKTVRSSNKGGKDKTIKKLQQELKRVKNTTFSKESEKVRDLENQLEQTRVFMDNEMEKLNQNLDLKSSQIIESQNEISILTGYIKRLENDLEVEKDRNLDVSKETRNLQEANMRLNSEKSRLERLIDDYKKDKQNLERKLEEDVDSKFQDIKTLIDERDKAKKERDSSISFQESLNIKINSLESSVKTLEDHNASLKLISEDQKTKLEEARNEIKRKEEDLKNAISSKEEIIEQFEKEIEEMEEENKEVRKVSDERNRLLNEKKKLVDQYKKQIEELNEENEDIREGIKSRREQLVKLEQKYEILIRNNQEEIDRLKSENENLSQAVEEKDNLFERLTTELVRSNREVDERNRAIEVLNEASRNLITELDSLRSNFGNLIASSEATSNNNTQEILRLNNRIKQLESKEDSVETYVNGLIESIDTYKDLLNESNKTQESLKEQFKEECDKLNNEKESLLQQLKNTSSKNEDDLRKKLIENENKYSLLYRKYENVNKDLESNVIERKKIEEREKILNDELKYKDSRIEAKDKEVSEKLSEIEKLKKQVEDANLNIRNSDFYKEQFEQKSKELDVKTREYNKLVQLSNRQDMDKYELEEEIRILQQEISDVRAEKELAQSKILPEETLDQMRHDIRNLNKLLDERDKDLKESRKKLRSLEGDKKNAINNFNRLKTTTTNKIRTLEDYYEKKIKRLNEKLIKTIKPQDLVAAGILLEDLNIEDYDNVNYDEAIKKLRDAREKFRKLIEDPNTPTNKKFMFKELDRIMQYRIDFLNVEFDKPVETSKGNEVLVISEKGKFLFLRRILLWIKNNPTSVITVVATAFSTIVTSLVYYVSLYGNYAKTKVVKVTKYIAKKAKQISPVIASATITIASHLINTITWFTKNILEIIFAAIIASITLYEMYGEEMTFLIISFWSFIIALSIVSIDTLRSYIGY